MEDDDKNVHYLYPTPEAMQHGEYIIEGTNDRAHSRNLSDNKLLGYLQQGKIDEYQFSAGATFYYTWYYGVNRGRGRNWFDDIRIPHQRPQYEAHVDATFEYRAIYEYCFKGRANERFMRVTCKVVLEGYLATEAARLYGYNYRRGIEYLVEGLDRLVKWQTNGRRAWLKQRREKE